MNTSLYKLSTKEDALTKVCVSYHLIYDGGSPYEAVLSCLSCTDVMHWDEDLNRYECPSCSYPLDLEAALHVIDRTRTILNTLNDNLKSKAGKQWGWVMWLQRLLGRRAILKS